MHVYLRIYIRNIISVYKMQVCLHIHVCDHLWITTIYCIFLKLLIFTSSTSTIYVDCNDIIFFSLFKSYECPDALFKIIRFREKRDLTYAAIAPHSHHVYNSDGILDHSWRNYTELTLRTAAQGSQHTVDYTYDVN